jgi:predicted ferric reductase
MSCPSPPPSIHQDVVSLASQSGYLLGPNAVFVTLPATRNSLLFWLFGLPFDRTILFHRWLGRWVVLLSLIHYIASIQVWAAGALSHNAKVFNTVIPKYLYGFISFVGLMLVFFTSVGYLRRKHFNFFFISHFFFVVFFVMGVFHSPQFAIYTYVALGSYILDLLFRTFWGNTMYTTQEFNVVDGTITKVRFKKSYLSKMVTHYQVGQYVFLNFPAVDLMEWHPYTVASAPSDGSLELYIKALGDHTNKLLEHAKLYVSVKMCAFTFLYLPLA